MISSLTSLLDEVNDLLLPLPYSANTTFYNLAWLQPKDDRVFPIARLNQREGIQIAPNDIKSMIFYHRLIGDVEHEPVAGKGSDTIMFDTYPLRLVGIGHRRKLSSLTNEDNSDLARSVELLLNGKTLSDRSKIWPVATNSDKIAIFNQEWEGYNFNNLSLELTAFYIDYNLKQRVVCVT